MTSMDSYGQPPAPSKMPAAHEQSEISTAVSEMNLAPVACGQPQQMAPHSYEHEWQRTRILKALRRLLLEISNHTCAIGKLCMDQELCTSLGVDHTTSEAQVDNATRDAIVNFCRAEYRIFEVTNKSKDVLVSMCPEWTAWWEVCDRATGDQDKLSTVLMKILSRHPPGPIHSDDLENVHEVFISLGGERLGHVLPQDVEWRDLRIASVFGEPDCVTVALANQNAGDASAAEMTALNNTWASIDSSGCPNPIEKSQIGGYTFEWEDAQIPLRLQLRSTKAGQAASLFLTSINNTSVLVPIDKFLLWTQAAIALGPEALGEFIQANQVNEAIKSGMNSPAAEGTALTTSSSSRPRNRRILAHYLRTSSLAKERIIKASWEQIYADWREFLEVCSYSNPRMEEQRFVWAEEMLKSLVTETEVDNVLKTFVDDATICNLPPSAFHCLRIAVCDLHSGSSGSPRATSTVTSETKALLSELKVEPLHVSTVIANVTKIAAKIAPDQVFSNVHSDWKANCGLALKCLESWPPNCKDYKIVMVRNNPSGESFPLCEALLSSVTTQGDKLDRVDNIIDQALTFELRYRQRCLLRIACTAALWVKDADTAANNWIALLSATGTDSSAMDGTPQLEVVLREVINRAHQMDVHPSEKITVQGINKAPMRSPGGSSVNPQGNMNQDVELVSEFLRANGPTEIHVVLQNFSKPTEWVKQNFDVRGTTVFLKLHQKRLFPSVYVSDIPSEWKEGQIREFLDKRVQHVESLRVLPSRRMSADTQACIVRFLTAEAAEIAVATLKGVSVQTARGNKYIGARIAKPSKREQQQMGEMKQLQNRGGYNNNHNSNNNRYGQNDNSNRSYGNNNVSEPSNVPPPPPGAPPSSSNGASEPSGQSAGTVKVGNVPMEWSEAYLREFLSAQEVLGLQFCTILAPKPGTTSCQAILKFSGTHHADSAMTLIPQLSFKSSTGQFVTLEVVSSPSARATVPGKRDYSSTQYGLPAPGAQYGQPPPPGQYGYGNSSPQMYGSQQGAPQQRAGEPAWDQNDVFIRVCNYLEQAASQIRDNLGKGMVPSPAQLEKYVSKLVDRMQMKMKGAPFHLWDAASQLFFPFWGFVSNSRIRDPGAEELLGVLEALVRSFDVPQAPQAPAQNSGAPASKRMRYDY